MAPNYSIHAIPVYWVLTLFPHAYAVAIVKKANNGKWNNVNARGVDTSAAYKKSIPADVFGRFERAEAAHHNLLENAPLFIGAVIVGNMMGLPAKSMNTTIGAYLALRVAYTFAYIKITRQRYAYLRSAIWLGSLGLLFRLYIKAGNVLLARVESGSV